MYVCGSNAKQERKHDALYVPYKSVIAKQMRRTRQISRIECAGLG